MGLSKSGAPDAMVPYQRQQVESLIKIISQGLYEKEHILAIALLCAVSGENMFLLGPPGTAKSEVSRRLKMIFKDAKAFEYLMSRFSTPDEIFGPVSIQKLKTEDTYERKVAGFLPDSTIVFLDEIWKAGPAIQNALLTVINERIYQNGTHTLRVPMKCLVAASNELPAEDEGLEALWDRFLVRVVSNCIKDEKAFYQMLTMSEMPAVVVPDQLLITDELYREWQAEMMHVAVPQDILSAITSIRQALAEAGKQDNVAPLDYYISDRRWRKIVHLLRASAFLNGRAAIDHSDLLLLFHTLWNKVECIEPVLAIVTNSLISDINSQTVDIEKECEGAHQELVSKNPEVDLSKYKVYDYLYLRLCEHPLGEVYFNMYDFKNIPSQGETNGLMYFSQSQNAYIIRHYDKNMRTFETSDKKNVTAVKLRRGNNCLFIDGQTYPFIFSDKQQRQSVSSSTSGAALLDRIATCKKQLNERFEAIKSSKNIFLSTEDLSLAHSYVSALDKRLNIAHVKASNL